MSHPAVIGPVGRRDPCGTPLPYDATEAFPIGHHHVATGNVNVLRDQVITKPVRRLVRIRHERCAQSIVTAFANDRGEMVYAVLSGSIVGIMGDGTRIFDASCDRLPKSRVRSSPFVRTRTGDCGMLLLRQADAPVPGPHGASQPGALGGG